MWVFVAVRALSERDPNISRLAIGPIDMALGALHRSVKPGERIPGFGVIELAHINGLPIDEVMTGLAVRSQSSFVLIFVARGATGGQTEVGAGQILFLDRGPFLRRDVRRIVALVTR